MKKTLLCVLTVLLLLSPLSAAGVKEKTAGPLSFSVFYHNFLEN